MKRLLVCLGCVSLIASCGLAQEATNAVPEMAEEKAVSPLSFHFVTTFFNEYTWRGSISEDTPTWQPSLTATYDTGDWGAISVNIWAGLFLTDKHTNRPKSMGGTREIDYTISYSKNFGDLGLELGHMWYTYPNRGKSKTSSQELYAVVSYETDIVTPSFSVYSDYTDSDHNDPASLYFYAAIDKTIPLVDRLNLDLSTGIGFANGAYNTYMTDDRVTDCQLVDYRATSMLRYAVTDFMEIGAFARYNWIASPVLRDVDYMGKGKDQLLFGGLELSLDF